MISRTSHRWVPAVLAAVVGLSACGSDEPTADPSDDVTVASAAPSEPAPTSSAEPSPAPSAEPSPEPSPSPSPSPTPDDANPTPEDAGRTPEDAGSSAAPSPTDAATSLAGEPFDGPPLDGMPATMAVIAIAADDVLNVRSGPGVDAGIIATLRPLATDVAATGAARLLPRSIWVELEVDDGTGWSNSSYLAFLGPTDDITSRLLRQVDDRPSAASLEELAVEVAELVASDDPPSRIVISDGPAVGDLGEVTVDVVGLGDDAIRGERLHIFAVRDGGAFTLRTVEATTLCARGPGGERGCP